MADLQGKTMIISGVGPGLGRRVALCAAREGANVVLGARTETQLVEVADEVVQRLLGHPAAAEAEAGA